MCYDTFFFAGIVHMWCGKKWVYWCNGEWNSGWKKLCCWLDVVALPACCLLVGVHNHSLYSLIALSLRLLCAHLGSKVGVICLNRYIKEEEVVLLWVGMIMWCVVNKNIKEKERGSCCTCFAPYNVRLLPLLLSKSNRFALPFFSVRDRGAIKKSNKNFVISQKMYYLCNALSPDGGIGRRDGLKHHWSNPCRFDPGSGYQDPLANQRFVSGFLLW